MPNENLFLTGILMLKGSCPDVRVLSIMTAINIDSEKYVQISES